MSLLRQEAVAWIKERIDRNDYCYCPTTELYTAEFAFKDPNVALEFKMRWA
jgi:hypothetical protein